MKYADNDEWRMILGGIAGGMDPNYWDSATGGTLLWKAIETNKYDVAKKLIKFGANIDFKAENGKTALMLAVEKVRFLSGIFATWRLFIQFHKGQQIIVEHLSIANIFL